MTDRKSIVLVVDDIQSNVEFISDILSTLPKIEIHGMNDGTAVLNFVQSKQPDLILLDVSMPVLDGFEVCKRLKANPKFASVPIIFLTARVQKEDIVRGFDLGAVDYIAKPFNLSELVSRVKTHLELRHKSNELSEMNLQLEELVKQRTRQLSETNKNLTEANQKLTDANEALSTLDHAKNDFIAHINHELRTPLNGILGYTSLLEEQACEESKEYVKCINVLVSRLIKVAEISLLLTELRTVDNKINIREVVLSDAINRAMPWEEIAKKNIEIDMKQINEREQVMGEPRLLTTCIAIVLDNAVKYSPAGSKISISGRDNDKFYSVDISDNGPGFSANALASIFEPFTADNLQHRTYGFGIGLATAKRIVDLLGGKITIGNKEKGASVVLHLKKERKK
jgi:two-component system, sensor histidine kinase and response regulator